MLGLRPRFNAIAFIFQMKNRFPNDYRDVHRVDSEHRVTTNVNLAVQAPTLNVNDRMQALKEFEAFRHELTHEPTTIDVTPVDQADQARAAA